MDKMDNLRRKIEALIFTSEIPVSKKDISSFLSITPQEAQSHIDDLTKEWADLNLSISIQEISGGYQLRTKEEFKDLLKEFINKKPFKISRAALEVLGIIANQQPTTKIEIDNIRGVDSSGVINVLADRELIKVVGEKEVPGRPYLYSTTDLFLEIFSLNSIKDLPKIEEFDEYEEEKEEIT
jgi:segregation and condensation protein B